jgi:hypothetical protein
MPFLIVGLAIAAAVKIIQNFELASDEDILVDEKFEVYYEERSR